MAGKAAADGCGTIAPVMRILVAGPPEDGCPALAGLLRDAGHDVEVGWAETPVPASFDLVILTRAMSRPERVREIRERHPALPLLVLTAEGSVAERVQALDAGADDALSVPFAGSQMVSRVRALGRRALMAERPPDLLEVDGCFIDLGRARASRDGAPIELSRREVDIVRWLHRHKARAVSRRELLEHVFGVSPDAETRSVDMAIAVLRKKLERDPKRPTILVSVKGVGYAWGDLTQT